MVAPGPCFQFIVESELLIYFCCFVQIILFFMFFVVCGCPCQVFVPELHSFVFSCNFDSLEYSLYHTIDTALKNQQHYLAYYVKLVLQLEAVALFSVNIDGFCPSLFECIITAVLLLGSQILVFLRRFLTDQHAVNFHVALMQI